MTRYDLILETIKGMGEQDLLAIHNNYCDKCDCMDDYIYNMNDFNEIMATVTPWEIARSCFYGDEFCPTHDYFYFDGYGNLESIDYIYAEGQNPIYIEDIAEYIDKHNNALYNDGIQKILDEYEQEGDA